MKRSFFSLFETAPTTYEAPVCPYQNPRKKHKKSLHIDIGESFAEKPLQFPPTTTSSTSRKLSFGMSANVQPCCVVKTQTTPRCSERGQITPELNLAVMVDNNDTLYDDFYQEEEAFNITMKKCHRRRMEDRVSCESSFDFCGTQTSYFGIYDGHRNSYVSDFLQNNLHNAIQNCPEVHSQPVKAIKEAFNKIDQEVLQNQKVLDIQGGSTALCAFISTGSLYLANVGDSKAIVVRNGSPVSLNIEHRANNEEERKNVENRGGFVFEKKGPTTSRFLVQGALELTRSIGDPSYKEFITCEPDVVEYKFDSEDEYIIMASDGFWNEITEKETISLINAHGKSQGLSKALVGEALKKRQYNIDNISLIVIDVQKLLKNLL